MSKSFYAVHCSLSWIFGHYFFNQTHYSYFSGVFYPYRLRNPKSSNPYEIYKDLYMPWKDRDDYDKFINQVRLNLRSGILFKESQGIVSAETALRLKRITTELDIVFFYPIVYRVIDDDLIPERVRYEGSALGGSDEILVPDLEERQFDILFMDFDEDTDFKALAFDEYHRTVRTGIALDTEQVLQILERRCQSGVIRGPIQTA